MSVLVYPTGDIMEGVSVTLTCSCGADASAAEYAWYKGSIRKGFGRTYAFHKIGSNDSGEYKCQGEDGRGDWFSITVHLDVKCESKRVQGKDLGRGTGVMHMGLGWFVRERKGSGGSSVTRVHSQVLRLQFSVSKRGVIQFVYWMWVNWEGTASLLFDFGGVSKELSSPN